MVRILRLMSRANIPPLSFQGESYFRLLNVDTIKSLLVVCIETLYPRLRLSGIEIQRPSWSVVFQEDI